MSYEQTITEDRRLTILRALQGAAGYRAAQFLVGRYLDQFGHQVSADRLQADLAWLREQGLIKLETPDNVYVATLTQRGLDVACGRADVPGVAKPQPGF